MQPPRSFECFSAVRQVREAALDARFLVVATDLGKEKATQMCAGNGFDPSTFTENLVSEFTVCTHDVNLREIITQSGFIQMVTGVHLTETCHSYVSSRPACQIRALNTTLSGTFQAC